MEDKDSKNKNQGRDRRDHALRRRHSTEAKVPIDEEADADVLLLFFEHNDIPELKKERSEVEEAFKMKGFKVSCVEITMRASWVALRPRLNRFLSVEKDCRKIIYYHGHGGFSENELLLASHNLPDDVATLQRHIQELLGMIGKTGQKYEDRVKALKKRYQEAAEIKWSDIKGEVLPAKCDVLVILDCCHSGAASISANPPKFEAPDASEDYAKEVIYATHWDSDTSNKMSPALCKALKGWDQGKDPFYSANRLVREMATILAEQRLEVEQELTEAVRKLERLNYLKNPSKAQELEQAKFEKKQRDLEEELDCYRQPGRYEMHKSRRNGTKERYLFR
ncbi:unnamed protein product [Clonostachys rosea]|uniref:Caspase family p20 domain-containing protein n=1 Tax=Bionectria ochroleuca TaxID=29856 RepID=A0ABY6UHP6_BIOOC|nr:unnamed protein product [Clonostachys rosea]